MVDHLTFDLQHLMEKRKSCWELRMIQKEKRQGELQRKMEEEERKERKRLQEENREKQQIPEEMGLPGWVQTWQRTEEEIKDLQEKWTTTESEETSGDERGQQQRRRERETWTHLNPKELVKVRGSETLTTLQGTVHTLSLQNWRLTQEEIDELMRLKKLEPIFQQDQETTPMSDTDELSLEQNEWQAIPGSCKISRNMVGNLKMEGYREVLAEADRIAQLEKLREIQRQRDTEIYIDRIREMERASDIERHQVRMREREIMRDIERKRERELVEELTRQEMKQEENAMKDMEEMLYDRQRTLEKQLEERIRKMENETRDKEMRLKGMEERCAKVREMERKIQKERVRESIRKRQREAEAKILEMERKLEKTRVMTQRWEEGLLGQIEHEQDTKMEAPRHIDTTMGKERLRHLDIQRELEQVKEECQDMGSEIRRERDRRSTLGEHVEIAERRLDTERGELERQQEMKKQLKKMEQTFEMERKRHDERWRETEDKTRELERMLEAERQAAHRRDQELLKLREELDKAKQEKQMKMERRREIEREDKRTTVREKEHDKNLKPRGRNAARKTGQDERLTKVTKQDTKEVKNLWNEGMDCEEKFKLKVVKGKSLQKGQQFMDEELFIKKERMRARKNKMEGKGEREMEGQQVERCGQLDEEINRNFKKEREMEQEKSEERCSELRKSRQKKRKEKAQELEKQKAQELEKQRKQEEEDAVQEVKKKRKKKTGKQKEIQKQTHVEKQDQEQPKMGLGGVGEETYGGEEQAEKTTLPSAGEEIPADAEGIETGGDGVQKERSVRRRVFGWVHEKAKNYYQKKIERTHVREEEEGHNSYVPCKIPDMAQEAIPADAEGIETGQSGGGGVQRERSVRRRVFGWVNEKAKNYYQKKIDRTHVREEEEGHNSYVPWFSDWEISRADREQEKRKTLLKAEGKRQKLENTWKEWEAKRKEKKEKKRNQEVEECEKERAKCLEKKQKLKDLEEHYLQRSKK